MPRPTAFALALFVIITSSITAPSRGEDPNSLSATDKKDGFELLFDGKALTGWKHKGNWRVEDGAMTRSGRGGSLTYVAKRVPDDFELRFQWKVAAGSNSGVYYRPGQYEYQILDNKKHADGVNPRTSAASLYFCMAPSKDVTRPVGEWNDGAVICRGTVIQHWLNGVKVIDFDYADKKYASDVERLKIRGAKLDARGAQLFLQDHGDPVWYRGFKWRTLTADVKLDRKPVTPQPLDEAAQKREDSILARYKNKKKK
ncbi:MAG: DUF1080 domain-containing protein [Pirellulaceae bacterium]|jgi:hypothetical protein|nr:DUF1080 domain-containing protein [Pirellulaceae bacterium]MDP7017598.1 DUF1080 domain-containing protein [Pirellulaceae bacterium]